MTTEGLRDTPPSGRKKGRITIVGEFAAGAPSWTYTASENGRDREDAIEEAELWLRETARARYKTGPKKLEALHQVLRNGPIDHLDDLRKALKACPDPMGLLVDDDGRDEFYWPVHALHAAFYDVGAPEVLEVLLEDPRVRKAVDKPNPQGWTALSLGALMARESAGAVRVLCTHGANPDHQVPLTSREDQYPEGRSLADSLLQRSVYGFGRSPQWETIRALLAAGARPPIIPDHQAFALGAVCGHIPWITQGAKAHMDINATAPAVYDSVLLPLDVAVACGDVTVVRALLEANAWVGRGSILFEAISPVVSRTFRSYEEAPGRRIIALVTLLLEFQADVRGRHLDMGIFDALAMSYGLTDGEALELAHQLKAAGAPPSPSAIRRAVENPSQVGIIKALLAVGCDPHAVEETPAAPMSAIDFLRAEMQTSNASRYTELLAFFDKRDLEAVAGGAPNKPTYKRAKKGGL